MRDLNLLGNFIALLYGHNTYKGGVITNADEGFVFGASTGVYVPVESTCSALGGRLS